MELLSPKIETVTNEAAVYVFSSFFVFFGMIFLAVGLILVYFRRKKIKSCLEKTMAELTEYRAVRRRDSDGHYGTRYHAVYEYYVNGMKYSRMSRYGLTKAKQDAGGEVLLHYSKENPELFFVEEDLRISKLLSNIFLGVGFGVFVLLIVLLLIFW